MYKADSWIFPYITWHKIYLTNTFNGFALCNAYWTQSEAKAIRHVGKRMQYTNSILYSDARHDQIIKTSLYEISGFLFNLYLR